MNARGRIMGALVAVDNSDWPDALTIDQRYAQRADAVLAVLPELLIHPEVIEQATDAYLTGQVSPMIGPRSRMLLALTAAAKALTEDPS